MALHPDTVDLSLLPPKGQKLVGVGTTRPPQDATAAFGHETLEAAAEIACNEIHHRLEHPECYRVHGGCLREGLWRRETN